MKATRHSIIIEPITHTQTESGIFISATEQDNPTGVVVSAGGGSEKMPMHVSDGDTVSYKENVGIELEHNGKNYLVLRESHIIGIL